MKKGFVAITAAVAIAASTLIGTSIAGIGPGRGLPSVVTTTGVTDMYNLAATIPGANGSVMCVACHTRNPSKRTAYGATQGTNYVGSHFVTANFNDSSLGGGYDGTTGKARSDRTSAFYMASTNATAGTGTVWAGAPRYGSTNPQTTPNLTTPTTGAQMICESCHSIVRNIGAAKLLAVGFANGADNTNYSVGGTALVGHVAAGGTRVPVLCIGCHSSMTAGVAAEWQYHPLFSTGTWSGTHHHRNTGTATYYGTGTPTTGHNMAVVDRAYFPVATTAGALQMWGAAYGELGTAARAITYDSSLNKKMKGGAGFTAGTAYGQIVVASATPQQLLCTNCHRAHNASTYTGGAILMASTAPGTAMGSATTANAVSGMGILTRSTLIRNLNPLCLTCHQ